MPLGNFVVGKLFQVINKMYIEPIVHSTEEKFKRALLVTSVAIPMR